MVGVESRDPRSATISMKISDCITCLLFVYFCCFSNFFLSFFSFSFNFFTLDMIACHGYITFSSFLFNNYVLFVRVFCPSHSYSPFSPLLYSAQLYSPLLSFTLLSIAVLYFTLLYSETSSSVRYTFPTQTCLGQRSVYLPNT